MTECAHCVCQNTVHLEQVKQSMETVSEFRKSEKTKVLESKLTAAEQKREKEMQKRLETVKKQVGRVKGVAFSKSCAFRGRDCACMNDVLCPRRDGCDDRVLFPGATRRDCPPEQSQPQQPSDSLVGLGGPQQLRDPRSRPAPGPAHYCR